MAATTVGGGGDDRRVSLEEAAGLAGVSRRTLLRLLERPDHGGLDAVKVAKSNGGYQWRVDPMSVPADVSLRAARRRESTDDDLRRLQIEYGRVLGELTRANDQNRRLMRMLENVTDHLREIEGRRSS